MSPRTSSLCSHIFLVLRDHWLYVCLHLKMEFRSCARGRQWCGIFHYHWWTASIKPRLLFSHLGIVSWGLPFLQFLWETTETDTGRVYDRIYRRDMGGHLVNCSQEADGSSVCGDWCGPMEKRMRTHEEDHRFHGFEPMISWLTAQNFNHWTTFPYINLMNKALNKPAHIVWQQYS